MTWTVDFHPKAHEELRQLPTVEQNAVLNAREKLKVIGPNLGHPHSSDVRGADRLRELRPRSGRSPWRAFYRRVGDVFVIAAVGPEAKVSPKGFNASIIAAQERLAEIEED